MVGNQYDIEYTVANDHELDRILAGEEAGISRNVRHVSHGDLYPGSFGVVWIRHADPEGSVVRPLALICRDEDLQRLCGRYAQLRGDLSPLSPWCHLIAPQFFDSIDSMWRDADLEGAEAAWTGLVIAEAVLLTERPLSGVRIQSCLATQSFAIARTHAFWKSLEMKLIQKRFDDANRICRNTTSRQERLRVSLAPLWDCLLGLSKERNVGDDVYPIVQALKGLRNARRHEHQNEASALAMALTSVAPEADQFYSLLEQPAEMRLRLFDRLVDTLGSEVRESRSPGNARRNALGLLAGYLATVAAGGAPSLSLVEAAGSRFPELVAWAYVAGSIGERVLWTSSFDGLGRLVARELLRPLRLDESPACDFALDEAMALVDTNLKDPVVRLRLKQARVVTVALFPGVNIAVPIDNATESQKLEARPSVASQQTLQTGNVDRLIGAIIEAIRPSLQREIREYLNKERGVSSQGDRKSKRRPGPNSQLQFPKK